ncbi:type IV pilus modification protein PilV [Pseudomonas sp. GD03842]|nr:type IV pilus modification protein PilV [Pseudomonas sp. GD03842]MDH0747932.1 type IV pilus modification protein PilV [Pseudomonas sp. GD03842]
MNVSAPSTTRGFSMIEVLVSLIIIAIGVLGMVALQSKAIPYTQDSTQRNTAIMLADDLIDIIRTAGSCTTANGCVVAPGASFPNPPDNCSPSPATLSGQIGCWADQAARALPGAKSLLSSSFYICRSVTPGDVTTSACGTSSATNSEIEIQIAWTVKTAADCMDANVTGTGTTCTYRIRTRLP